MHVQKFLRDDLRLPDLFYVIQKLLTLFCKNNDILIDVRYADTYVGCIIINNHLIRPHREKYCSTFCLIVA